MMEVFKDYISEHTFLSRAEIDRILRVCIKRRLAARQHLLQEGNVWKWHVFVTEGCLRTYYLDNDDVEHTVEFAIPGCWTGDRESLVNAKPSAFNIDAIFESEVILIGDNDYRSLCSGLPSFNSLANNILLKAFRMRQKKVYVAVSHTVTEKYSIFRDSYPEVADRIPQNMIASYLGITSEHLSRSRTGKYDKKG